MISMTEMAELARALIYAEQATKSAEEELKATKERERILREETLPSAMQELGVEEFKLDTGQKISVKQEVYASIPAERKLGAYAWLDEHGFGGLIKTEVSVAFPKSERDNAVELLDKLKDQGFEADLDMSIHAMTLKSFIKEQLSNGADLPMDLFGARAIFQAKISTK